MRNYVLSLVVFFGSSSLFLRLYDNFSPESIRKEQNVENIYLVKVGMNKNEVIQIMGMPDDTIPPMTNSPYYQFTYGTNYDSFSYLRVLFDTTMYVQEVYVPSELQAKAQN